MTHFRATENALAELPSNERFSVGEHLDSELSHGSYGLTVGSVPFDPTRHAPYEVDYLSPMGLALGEPYVREVLPLKPMHLSVVLDATTRSERTVITQEKFAIAQELIEAIDGALPGMTDRVMTYVVSDNSRTLGLTNSELIRVADSEQFISSAAELASSGLTFVLSDFNRISEKQQAALRNVVAVKVDHLLDRELIPGIGRYPIANYADVNTDKPRQVAKANKLLQERHITIHERLQRLGASVASVIVDRRLPAGFDIMKADNAVAGAIEDKKHNR